MDLVSHCNELISKPKNDSEEFISGLKIKRLLEKKYKEVSYKKDKLKFALEYRSGRNEYLEFSHTYAGDCFEIDNIEYLSATNELKIIMHDTKFYRRYTISFTKNNDDFTITSSDYDNNAEILEYADIFSKLYDLYKKNNNFFNIPSWKFYHSINEQYAIICVSPYDFTIYIDDITILHRFVNSYYEYPDIKNKKDLNFLKRNTESILDHLYFSVSSMPDFIKEELDKENKIRLKKAQQESELLIHLKEQEEKNQREQQERYEEKERKKEKFIPFYKLYKSKQLVKKLKKKNKDQQ